MNNMRWWCRGGAAMSKPTTSDPNQGFRGGAAMSK
ncbi:hypothetical protein A2U01_0098443, partial [Trifolium medium]|nr:hypothetical protein [Trifolium medium]